MLFSTGASVLTGNQGLPCFLWDGAACEFLGRGISVLLGLGRCAGQSSLLRAE